MFNLKPALRAGVPIVIIETSDPAQSMRAALEQLNGKANTSPLLEYALLKGLSAINDPGADFINSAFRDVDVRTMSIADVLGGLNQPSEFERLRSADTPAYIFLHNPQLMWDTSEEAGRFVAQGLWSLRDVLKPSGSMLIGLAPLGVKLPNLLTNDAVIIKDTLPNREEIAAIVARILKAAKLSLPDNAERIYDALTGLSAFAAEQVLSMDTVQDLKSTLNLPETDFPMKANLPASERSVDRWFATEHFTAPAAYSFGNAGRNVLLGPPYANWDLSLIKQVRVSAGQLLEFRLELFNAFNHTNFEVPSAVLGTSTFGQIFGAARAREMEVAVRYSF